MIDQPNTVLVHLLGLAERYSGCSAQPDDCVYRDLDINGSDFIEFVEEIEGHYGVDLSCVSPRQSGVEAQDPTIGALATEVLRQRP